MFNRPERTVAFPDVTDFRFLFDSWTTDKAQAPAPVRVKSLEIGPFLHFRSHKPALWVTPTEHVVLAILDRTIHIEDRMSFEVVERGDGTALVTAHHGQIIGSVWLAIVDANTLPS